MIVRHACKEDCAAIGEIYNHAVLHTAAIWNDKTVDTDNRIAWFEARTLSGYPVLVSEEDGVVTGYASFGDWRAFDGFRHTVMVAGIEAQNQASIHLHETLGFITTGNMPQVGTKFGRWLDLTFMQLQLDERSDPDALP